MVIETSAVINAILRVSSGPAQRALERNEALIGLKKRLGLDPERPPDDFDAAYAYALVEYGVYRPESVLNFFRHEFVREAFRQSFYQNDFSILEREAEETIRWNEETRKLGRLDFDPRREFAAFTAAFEDVVQRARTPTVVRQDQKLDQIHQELAQGFGKVVSRLDEFSLNELRVELTQLHELRRRTALDTLADDLRGWFDALGYAFEPHEQRGEAFFEWIINIPTRRKRYDRILVHGIEGEAELGHVTALKEATDHHRTDEGWLITSRRKSQAASSEVAKPENEGRLLCYTFDELLDQDADFSGYLDWLEAEVKRRGIDTMYVPLACTKDEVDPDTNRPVAKSRYDERNGWIDGYVTRWLHDPSKAHLSVLGEFGTGKTWFALHYAWTAMQEYKKAKDLGIERPRLPLVISLRDYAKAVSVESLFSEFFFRKHEIPLANYSAFAQLNRMGKLLLIFDGFDEMAARVDRQQMINNFWELAKVVVVGSKAILTCRTEHFPDAIEGRRLLGAELLASTAVLTGEPPEFEVLELEKFDEDQIRRVLSSRAAPATVERILSNQMLADLASRPVMIELILEALPDIEEGKPIDIARVYLYAVRRRMERDITDERTFTSMADKLYFMCELSWEMLSTDQMSINYRLFPDRLRRLFGTEVQEQKDLDHWHYDMMGQNMLIRNADGDYAPAHRSMLEFFVACKFAGELGVLADDFLDVARAQTRVDWDAEPVDDTWTSYFQRAAQAPDRRDPRPPLRRFVPADVTVLVANVGAQPISPAVLEFLSAMLGPDPDQVKQRLLEAIQTTRDKTSENVGLLGNNVANILLAFDVGALKGRDLSRTNLHGLEFDLAKDPRTWWSAVDLSGSNFNAANFRDAVFPGSSRLRGVDFRGCDLTNAVVEPEAFYAGSLRPGRKQLALAAGPDLLVWDLGTNSIRARIELEYAATVHYSPDGRMIATASSDHVVLVDADTMSIIGDYRLGPGSDDDRDSDVGWIHELAFSPDSSMIVAGDSKGNIHTLDTTNLEHRTFESMHPGVIVGVSFNSDGRSLATTSGTELIIWKVEGGSIEKLRELAGGNPPEWDNELEPTAVPARFGQAIFHPSRDELVVFDRHTGVVVIDPHDLRELKVLSQMRSALVTSTYHHFQGRLVEEFFKHSLCFSPDGTLLVSVYYNEIDVIEYESNTIIGALDRDMTVRTTGYSFSGDGPSVIDRIVGEIESTMLDQDRNLYIVSGSSALVYDIDEARILQMVPLLPDVDGADFRGAIGISSYWKDWLARYNARV